MYEQQLDRRMTCRFMLVELSIPTTASSCDKVHHSIKLSLVEILLRGLMIRHCRVNILFRSECGEDYPVEAG